MGNSKLLNVVLGEAAEAEAGGCPKRHFQRWSCGQRLLVMVMVEAGRGLETVYLVSHTFEFVPSRTEDTWAALLLLKTRELHGSPPDCGAGTGLL